MHAFKFINLAIIILPGIRTISEKKNYLLDDYFYVEMVLEFVISSCGL